MLRGVSATSISMTSLVLDIMMVDIERFLLKLCIDKYTHKKRRNL